MISPRKLRANRANSLRSTARKQRRAARMLPATRAARACAFPSCQILRVEALAQKIAGNGPPELVELARKIAEAEIAVIRVRRARTDLISRVDFGLRDQTSVDPGFSDKLADAVLNRARKIAETSKSAPLELRELLKQAFEELDRSMEGLEFLTRPPQIGPEFAIIDR